MLRCKVTLWKKVAIVAYKVILWNFKITRIRVYFELRTGFHYMRISGLKLF